MPAIALNANASQGPRSVFHWSFSVRLDDRSWLKPVGHIWIRSAQPWFSIPTDSLLYDGQPPDLSALTAAWKATAAEARL
jgi:hypothetical protein